jgi:hypothetical protein
LLRRASTRLQGLGVQFDPQCPPRQLARLVLQQLGSQPAFAQAMHDWLLRLEAQRYAPPRAQPLKLQTLARELQRLPRPT